MKLNVFLTGGDICVLEAHMGLPFYRKVDPWLGWSDPS